MITSTAMTGNYAVAQNSSSSNMSSASATNETASSTQANLPYRFERGYPAPGTAERAYNDADLGRAIEVYKYFYPTVSVEAIIQVVSPDKPNEGGVKFAAGPRHQAILTPNSDTPYGIAVLDLKAGGPMVVILLQQRGYSVLQNYHSLRTL